MRNGMESEVNRFWNADYDRSFTLEELANADRETQKEVMRTWFLANYENPAQRTPYDSSEGGYIYIWGGPYGTEDLILENFEERISHDVIQELVDELEQEQHCVEWTNVPREDDYDDYYWSVLLSNTEFNKTLVNNLENIIALLDVEVDEHLRQHYLRLLFISVITALESFLSDGFLTTVMSDTALIRKFVETNPDFATRKFALNELFQRSDEIEHEVRRYCNSLMWHNLKRIKPMYKKVLDIEFPKNLGDLFRAILLRHDFVHRNGKTVNDKEVIINKMHVSQLIESVRSFGGHVDRQFGPNPLSDF